MKKIIFAIALLIVCTTSYSQINCCGGDNLIVNGNFESTLSAPTNQSNNIHLANFWSSIWTIGNLADLYDENNAASNFPLPSPMDGNYASCWIYNYLGSTTKREGMKVKLGSTTNPINIQPNSGNYILSVDVASLYGNGQPEIGIYGLYDNGTPVNNPQSSHDPSNLDLFGSNNTVLLGTIEVPNNSSGVKEQKTLSFSSTSSGFPINGIDHIFITRGPTIFSASRYVAFDNFCLNSETPINLPFSSYAFCDGNYEEICGPNGTSFTYEWFGPTLGGNTSELLSEDQCFMPNQTGSYLLIFTDASGCSNFQNITITNEIIQPNLGNNIVVCEGDYYTGNINIAGQGYDNPNYTITWYHNGQEVQAGGETLMTTFADGEITVVVSSNGCEPVSDSITITQEPCCPDDLELAFDCHTGELYVENLPADITIETIFWNLDNVIIPSVTDTTLQVTEAGTYSFGIIFTLSNGVECHHFIHYTLSEDDCPNTIFCPDDLELTMNCETGELYVENLPSDITINNIYWWLNNDLISTANTTLQINEAGMYSFGIIFTLSTGVECHHFIHYEYEEDECCDITGGTISVDFATEPDYIETIEGTPHGTVEFPIFCDSFRLSTNNLCEDEYYISVDELYPSNWSVGANYYNGLFQGNTPSAINLFNQPYNLNLVSEQYYLITFTVYPGGATQHLVFGYDMPSCHANPKMTISPNPFQNNITIDFEELQFGSVEVLNMYGQVIRQKEFVNKNIINFNLRDLDSGVYFIKFYTEGEVFTKQIIKN